jgi:hypothetical protein
LGGGHAIRSNLFASKQAKRISTTIVAAMHPLKKFFLIYCTLLFRIFFLKNQQKFRVTQEYSELLNSPCKRESHDIIFVSLAKVI